MIFIKNKLQRQNRKSGLTLVEVLVVIAIIGLLSSTILITTSKSRASAREAQRIEHMREIQKAVEFYHNEKGFYPATCVGNLTSCTPAQAEQRNSCDNPNDYVPNVVPRFLQTLPKDPLNCLPIPLSGQPGAIEYRSDGHNYKISFLNEGQDTSLRSFFDPARDGGTSCQYQDGNNPNHYAIWQQETACW